MNAFRPFALLAELTYRCPLHCPYCSNPTQYPAGEGLPIWTESESFNCFRGTDWMPEPCRSCPRQEVDFGGCRCQAALITGNAANTDPVCTLSPRRVLVDRILEEAAAGEGAAWVLRQNPVVARAHGAATL